MSRTKRIISLNAKQDNSPKIEYFKFDFVKKNISEVGVTKCDATSNTKGMMGLRSLHWF